MFESITEAVLTALGWGLYGFLYVFPVLAAGCVMVVLAIIVDAVVRPRVQLDRAIAAATGAGNAAWVDDAAPRAWLAARPLPRGISRYLVVPGALATAAVLVRADVVLVTPIVVPLLLLARAAHTQEYGAIEVARSALRGLGLLGIAFFTLSLLFLLYYALVPLALAVVVYGASCVRGAAGAAMSALLVGALLVLVFAHIAVTALPAPLALVAGAIAWRIEIAREAVEHLAARASVVQAVSA